MLLNKSKVFGSAIAYVMGVFFFDELAQAFGIDLICQMSNEVPRFWNLHCMIMTPLTALDTQGARLTQFTQDDCMVLEASWLR